MGKDSDAAIGSGMNGSARETLIVADDHPLFREGMRRITERLYPQALVREAATMEQVLAMLILDTFRTAMTSILASSSIRLNSAASLVTLAGG